MEGDYWYKVLITPELLDTMLTRDHNGNALTYEVSEPDRDGFRGIVITTHYDDNLCEHLKCCGNCGHHREGEEPYEGIWMDCQAWEKGDVSIAAQMPSSPCFFTPSRWQECER